MKLKRNYLTSEEINAIIGEVVTRQTSFARRLVSLALVAQMLIEDLPHFDTCDDIYDYLMENEIDLYESVINIYDIDECVAEELGTSNVVKNFLNEMEIKLDELGKSIDTENMTTLIEQIKEMQESKGE